MGKQALVTHKAVAHGIHESENNEFQKSCDLCNKIFDSENDLQKHWNQDHTILEKIQTVTSICHNCNIEFKSASELNCHQINCLSNNIIKYFKCDICTNNNEEINWHSSNSLRKHIAEFHNLVLNICEICGQKFNFKYQIEEHKKSVHEESEIRSFVCNYCGKVLATKTTLNGHIGRMHEPTGKPRFQNLRFAGAQRRKAKRFRDFFLQLSKS